MTITSWMNQKTMYNNKFLKTQKIKREREREKRAKTMRTKKEKRKARFLCT